MDAAAMATNTFSRTLGNKTFEESNHLGNVLVVATDNKIAVDDQDASGNATPDGTTDYYKADVAVTNDYYAFGFPMAARSLTSPNYRYGFNGKENDNTAVSTGQGIK